MQRSAPQSNTSHHPLLSIHRTDNPYSYSSCPSGYYERNGSCYSNNGSSWNYWGRWVLAAIVIIFFIVLVFFWTCLSNRRRRRRGVQPRYGTGWMMPGPQQPPQYGNGWFGQHGKGNGNVNNNVNNPPPPQYTPAAPVGSQYTGQTFNTDEGYYGHHNNDIPLQQPSSSYHPHGGNNVYEPPAGPPPGKA